MVFCFSPGFFWPGLFFVILSVLRIYNTSKSIDMNTPFYVLTASLILLLSASCNSVKKVMNDPDKTKQVVDKYLQDYPIDRDTIITHIPGDTLLKVIIGYDTTVNHVHDTVFNTITKTVTRNISIHDTTKIQLPPDTKTIEGYKKILSSKDNDAALKAERFKTEQGLVDYWRIRFWILVGIISILIGLKFYFKL